MGVALAGMLKLRDSDDVEYVPVMEYLCFVVG